MPAAVRPEKNGPLQFEWERHTGLLLGGLTALFICFKIHSVAFWDLNTAFAILTENGTANVVTGSLLMLLTVGLVPAALHSAPWFLQKYNHSIGPDRFLWVLSGLFLLFFIVLSSSLFLVVFSIAILLLRVTVALIAQREIVRLRLDIIRFRFLAKIWELRTKWLIWKNRRAAPEIKEAMNNFRKKNEKVVLDDLRTEAEETAKDVSKHESLQSRLSLNLPGLLFLIVVIVAPTMPSPWIAPEIANIEGRDEAVYLLSTTGEKAAVLRNQARTVIHIDAELLTGKICKVQNAWMLDPLPVFIFERDYDECPTHSVEKD